MKNVKSLKVVEEATIPKAERKRRKNLKKKMKTDHRFLFLLIALGIITLATAVKLTKPSAKKAAAKKAALKEKKETPLVKKLSEKEVARITKETKAALATLVSLPDPPFTNILLGLRLNEYNIKEICSYWFNIAPRITAILDFADCVPTVAYLTDIANALTPLANIPSIKISSADKTQRDTFNTQLRNGIKQIAASCVNLANGNLPMFNLTTFRL